MPFIPSTSELINADFILAQGGIRQGMKVADLGCGTTGHFVFPAAELVGKDGKVYAVDIQKGVLAAIESRQRLENLNNIEIVWSDIEMPGATKIPEASLDMVLLINNLFVAKEKDKLVKEIMRLMAPSGKVVVVDWKTTQAPFGPPVQDRVSAEEAKKIFTAHALVLDKEFEAGKYHYGLVFNKK
jgi:ubiquinone/menaquinone biosynthesis C-methylase UbiE